MGALDERFSRELAAKAIGCMLTVRMIGVPLTRLQYPQVLLGDPRFLGFILSVFVRPLWYDLFIVIVDSRLTGADGTYRMFSILTHMTDPFSCLQGRMTSPIPSV